ncbi:hypothetical protein BGZ65_005297 [Modicella reniformis]|uniref:Uncharacterized protein n=1 Tax=Modicella reniformis TaxID=1440133 RepID=A0A9P6IKD0_9FUNG|nr:hypothetical protein BGZ65_005297 [Modicella reniformis]
MLSRSPSMGPVSSSTPGSSPYPHWGHDGATSPQPYPPYGYHYGYHGYPYPGPPDPSHSAAYQQQQKQATSPPTQSKPRPKSLQPEPIFIQEEPWNVQRKRSASNVSGKTSKAGAQDKKKTESVGGSSRPTSPASSVTSSKSYPTSPNPKKRTQLTRYYEGEDEEADAKRSKQVNPASGNGAHQRDSGVIVVVEAPESQSKNDQKDEDAAQALTSLAQTPA